MARTHRYRILVYTAFAGRESSKLIDTLLPMAVAALAMVASVIDELLGSRRRSSWDHVRLEASVNDAPQLRWWLLAFGDNVEVKAPAALREQFASVARSMAVVYAGSSRALA